MKIHIVLALLLILLFTCSCQRSNTHGSAKAVHTDSRTATSQKTPVVKLTDTCTEAMDRKDSLSQQIKGLSHLIDSLAYLNGNAIDTVDVREVLNDSIGNWLFAILSTPGITNYRLECLLKDNCSNSADRRLWAFEWANNTGGSFKSCSCYMCLRNDREQVYQMLGSRPAIEGGGIGNIYSLHIKQQTIYLIEEYVKGCNTCNEFAIEAYTISDSGTLVAAPVFDDTGSRIDIICRDAYDTNGNWNIGLNYDAAKKQISGQYILDDISDSVAGAKLGDRIIDTYTLRNDVFVHSRRIIHSKKSYWE